MTAEQSPHTSGSETGRAHTGHHSGWLGADGEAGGAEDISI
ncbi:MAG TPA: hypothetical protein VKT75_06530 [Acidobacteriaceae bacterium]|nr:hypothetical protein [Acidobacteriaceae bacterium]